MASAIMKEVHLRGYSPEDFILFVGGGAGATHAEGFKGDIRKAVTFPFSPVFCAFGSSTMDIMHVYEVSKKLTLMSPGTQELTDEFAAFNSTVEELSSKPAKISSAMASIRKLPPSSSNWTCSTAASST